MYFHVVICELGPKTVEAAAMMSHQCNKISPFPSVRVRAGATALDVKAKTSLSSSSSSSSSSLAYNPRVQINGIGNVKINGTAQKNKNNVGFKDFVEQKSGINLLPEWSVLLAGIATIILAAEKKWSNYDWKWKLRRPQMFDEVFRFGRFVEDNLVFRQNFAIRSYEVGPDNRAPIETLMNHLQETALNRVWLSGLAGDRFGATLEMSRRNLIWVVARTQIQVESYPSWGDILEIDAWVDASGKNGMRWDWLVRDIKTNAVLTRATSTWVMMNRKTRKLSKIPNVVREEIQPYFTNKKVIVEEDTRKINKIKAGIAPYICSNLIPRWSDLDANQHVNNIKYIGWILESMPTSIVEENELASITLEYRRECRLSHTLQSLASPQASDEDGMGSSSFTCVDENLHMCKSSHALQFTHLLQLQDDKSEILRARTKWRPKGAKKDIHIL